MIRKLFLHSYLTASGDRVPWKISEHKDRLEALSKDDRIEEVYCMTEEDLDAIKQQEVEAVIEAARQICDSIASNDIRFGEICTGLELIERLVADEGYRPKKKAPVAA